MNQFNNDIEMILENIIFDDNLGVDQKTFANNKICDDSAKLDLDPLLILHEMILIKKENNLILKKISLLNNLLQRKRNEKEILNFLGLEFLKEINIKDNNLKRIVREEDDAIQIFYSFGENKDIKFKTENKRKKNKTNNTATKKVYK